MRQVVRRYGSRLPVLEVWNEPNLGGFWKDPNPTNYLALLKRTYETVKEANPSIRVAFGGTSGVPMDFIREVYKNGGAGLFDIMNVHPYVAPFRPEWNLDLQLESLRRLMAEYGDGEKPLWITEIGWPTHRASLARRDLLLAGLEAARPGRASWRIVYVPAHGEAEGDLEESVCRTLEGLLPEGSRVEACLPGALGDRIRKGGVDAVAYPFSEDYASDSVDAVHAFVKAGGVLLDFGGAPMYYAYRTTEDGLRMARDKNADPAADRRRLRVDLTASWMDGRYPGKAIVRPTAAASKVETPEKGFSSWLFLTDRLLKPGDEFIPLLKGRVGDLDVVSAAVYRFDSDMKGAVVVSCLYQIENGACTEERQAKMAARALGIAFAEGVENFFWYEFREPGASPFDSEHFYGLVHDNFAPKPALGAYMTFISARPVGSARKDAPWRSPDGWIRYPQWTRPDGRMAGMIWTTGGDEERKAVFSSPTMAFLDKSGAKLFPVCDGGVYTLRLSGSPIYFSGGELKGLR